MCTADNKIDSVYTGDVYNSPEFVVNSQLASDSISDIVLPEATLSLKVAYQKEGFENSALSASNQKIIHRNRLGLAFNVTKNIYKLPKTIGTQILGATTQGSSQPYLSPVYNGKGSLEYSEKTTLYYPWLGQIREIYKRLSNVLTDTSGNYNSKGLYNQTIKPVEDNITLASNDSSNNTPFDFSYKASNSATVINFNYDKIITDLKSANNLATCSDLDSFSDFINLNVKKINDSSVKTNLLSAITHTDCIGNKADFDPLESYLCNYLPNGIPNCNLATYINKSANTITTPDGYSCVSNIPTGSTTVTPIVESGADNKVTIIGEASNSVTIHSPINGATAKLISQPLHDGHPAIDYAVPTGTEVHAATDGFVVYAGVATNASASCHSLYNTPNGGFGNVIMIEYNNCLSSVYAHLNDFNVKVGQHVTAGDVIAHVDHSGNVSGGNGGDGSHLHFELRSCAGNGPGVPEYSYLKDDPNQYKYIYDPTCLFDSSAKCRIEKSAALNPSTSIDPTSCNNNAGNSPSSSSTALPTSNLTSSSSPNGDTSQLAQCQISDDNYSGATFDPTYSSDNLSKRVLNSCGFNFSNSNFTADKAKQIVDSYGCLTDRVEYNVYQSRGGNYSVGPTQILQRRQVRNTRIDQIFAATGNNTGLAAAAFCTWFAESGSGFSNGVGRGLDCGIGSADCNPNTPVSNLGCSRVDKSTKERLSCTDPNDLEKIFSNELSCLTKTNPACTLVSHSDASGNDLSVFYPEKPGPWLENYGPVSDGNASYADKVIRCMTYIVGAGRTDAQGNIYSPQADGTLKDSKGNGFTHDQNNIATNDGSWVKDDFTKLGCYPFPNTTNLYPSIIYSGVSCNDNFLTQPDKFQQKT